MYMSWMAITPSLKFIEYVSLWITHICYVTYSIIFQLGAVVLHDGEVYAYVDRKYIIYIPMYVRVCIYTYVSRLSRLALGMTLT